MTAYAQTQIYPREVYNYSLPDTYYGYGPGFPRDIYDSPESVPRSCIDPQQLMVSSPMSTPLSSPVNEYAFPTAPYPVYYGPSIEMTDQTEYLAPSQRRRPAQAMFPQDNRQKMSYTLERNASHKVSQDPMYFRSDLPTPPLSPSSTIPTSASTSSPISPTELQSIPTVTVTAAATPSSQRHYCNHTDCLDAATGRPIRSFSRRADLQRHNATAHEEGTMFSCPLPNCGRKDDNGFTRMDHLIEHRRGYHHQNIPKRNSRSGSSVRRASKSPGAEIPVNVVGPVGSNVSLSTSKAENARSSITPHLIGRTGLGPVSPGGIRKSSSPKCRPYVNV